MIAPYRNTVEKNLWESCDKALVIPKNSADTFITQYLPNILENSLIQNTTDLVFPKKWNIVYHLHIVRDEKHFFKIIPTWIYRSSDEAVIFPFLYNKKRDVESVRESKKELLLLEEQHHTWGKKSRCIIPSEDTQASLHPADYAEAKYIIQTMIPVLKNTPKIQITIDDDVPTFEEIVGKPSFSYTITPKSDEET